MRITTQCFAAVLGIALVQGPALFAAEHPALADEPGLPETERPSIAAAEQRRADRAVLTLRQDARGQIIVPGDGQRTRPLTPKNSELTRSVVPTGHYEIIPL
ncbi:hypothetical protein M0534_11905 [Methylonatrum kenyense]|uniref:hypothetical protein n=1 Tax=Methylonatrum kenyense TaxID=455253 RepID=UPI0020BF0FA8|nr:hypothetical protein [Methylonatrum kenyense]MCK8517023.1 hypothetical protein [Methylonatrum kenyense]